MVRSRRCRTTVMNFRKSEYERSREILRTARRETSETKYEGGVRSRVCGDSRRILRKKILLSRPPQEIHHPSTGFPHAFASRFGVQAPRVRSARQAVRGRSTLDSLRTANYSEVLHAQSNLHVAGRAGVARLRGAGVCRVGHAVPRLPQRRHGHRQLRRVRARRRSARVLDADRRGRRERCGRSRAFMSSICRCRRSTGPRRRSTPSPRGTRTTWRTAPSPITRRWPATSPRR